MRSQPNNSRLYYRIMSQYDKRGVLSKEDYLGRGILQAVLNKTITVHNQDENHKKIGGFLERTIDNGKLYDLVDAKTKYTNLDDKGVTAIQIAAVLSYRTRNLKKLDVNNNVFVHANKILNGEELAENEKVKLNELLIIRDLSYLKKPFDRLNSLGIIQGNPQLEALYAKITTANKLEEYFNNQAKVDFKFEPGSLVFRKLKANSIRNFFIKNVLTEYGHAAVGLSVKDAKCSLIYTSNHDVPMSTNAAYVRIDDQLLYAKANKNGNIHVEEIKNIDIKKFDDTFSNVKSNEGNTTTILTEKELKDIFKITGHTHDEGESKNVLSHVDPELTMENFNYRDFLYNDTYRIQLDKLVSPKNQDLLKQLYGDDWKLEINKMYENISRELHDEQLLKLNVVGPTAKQFGNVVKGTFLPFGHTKISSNSHDKMYNYYYQNWEKQEKSKYDGANMLCSEFAARTLVVSLMQLNKTINEKLSEKGLEPPNPKENIVKIPISKQERLSTITPSRLLDILQKHKCIVQTEPTFMSKIIRDNKSHKSQKVKNLFKNSFFCNANKSAQLPNQNVINNRFKYKK